MVDYYRVRWEDGENGGQGTILQCQEILDIGKAVTADWNLEQLNQIGYLIITSNVLIYKLSTLPAEGYHSTIFNRVRKKIDEFVVKDKLMKFINE